MNQSSILQTFDLEKQFEYYPQDEEEEKKKIEVHHPIQVL